MFVVCRVSLRSADCIGSGDLSVACCATPVDVTNIYGAGAVSRSRRQEQEAGAVSADAEIKKRSRMERF